MHKAHLRPSTTRAYGEILQCTSTRVLATPGVLDAGLPCEEIFQLSVLRTRNDPIASTSIRVRLKQSMASSGVQTIGSFSLKLVFKITGMPVRRSKARIRSK